MFCLGSVCSSQHTFRSSTHSPDTTVLYKNLTCRSLREDIPCTLQRSPDMEIYADNIAFTDNISPRMGHQTNVVQGHEAYSRQLWSLRFHAALLFSKSHVSFATHVMCSVIMLFLMFAIDTGKSHGRDTHAQHVVVVVFMSAGWVA